MKYISNSFQKSISKQLLYFIIHSKTGVFAFIALIKDSTITDKPSNEYFLTKQA